MAEGRSDGEEDDPNDIVPTSLTLTPETITSPPPLPILPFDVLTDILCMLPVKLLVQLRCLCKFFNSLISDPKFVKKHLQSSTKRRHLMLTTIDHQQQFVMYDSPIPSLFSTSTIVAQTQLYPPNGDTYASVKCSCDGIFLGMFSHTSYFLWNPSIRKFKLLPPLENQDKSAPFTIIVPYTISFGYDCFIDKYKVIAVSSKNEVFLYTLGTDYWKRIDDIPYYCTICRSGLYVSGAVNWNMEIKSLGLNCAVFLTCTITVSKHLPLYIFLRMINCSCSVTSLTVARRSWLSTIPKLVFLIFLSFKTTMNIYPKKSTLRV
ncbi:F-box protein interaction domain protein [Medicago truncatula]|uniref:F-box protein interaction domain protein n=1 Tax=Medicago truncatula TaxID=3880 RepID=A0A072UTG8_MEDTR|nr:F-box protein interaction domain protein [Medicago truncatula]